jgi:hypothetical protein
MFEETDYQEIIRRAQKEYLSDEEDARRYADGVAGIESRLLSLAESLNDFENITAPTFVDPNKLLVVSGLYADLRDSIDAYEGFKRSHLGMPSEDWLMSVCFGPWDNQQGYQARRALTGLESVFAGALPAAASKSLFASTARYVAAQALVAEPNNKQGWKAYWHFVKNHLEDYDAAFSGWDSGESASERLQQAKKRFFSEIFPASRVAERVQNAGLENDSSYRRRVAALWADQTGFDTAEEVVLAAQRRLDRAFEKHLRGVTEQYQRSTYPEGIMQTHEMMLFSAQALHKMVSAEKEWLHNYLR